MLQLGTGAEGEDITAGETAPMDETDDEESQTLTELMDEETL